MPTPDAALRQRLFTLLSDGGWIQLHIILDGSCDEGLVKVVSLLDQNGNTLVIKDPLAEGDPSVASSDLLEMAEHLAFMLLDQVKPGWANDYGAEGAFVLDVPSRSIALEFEDRTPSFSSISW